MSPVRRLPLIVGLLVLLVYAVRLPGGWVGGVSYTRGRQHAGRGNYERALPHLERAGVGFNRAAILWLKGQVLLGLWHQRLAEGGSPAELMPLLEQAHRDYTEAITLSPASGWYRASLGDLHHQRERIRRFRQGDSLARIQFGPWASVGRSGRLAIGFNREAIEREPFVYTFHDQLALVLLDYGFEDEALEAVARSAQVQPIYSFHAYTALAPEPPGLMETFADAAERALGRTPYLRPVLHLLGLARLEIRRGRFEQAEKWARAALDEPGEAVNRAQGHFELGRALLGQRRLEEADAAFMESALQKRFTPGALAMRARVALDQGNPQAALDRLAEARRLRPRDLGLALSFARIALEIEDWDRADEAIRWARLIYPTDTRPAVLQVEMLIARGDRAAAELALDGLARQLGESREVLALRERLRVEISH